MGSVEPFDPLAKRNLATSIEHALMESEPIGLAHLEQFKGAGIYALYYTGSFPAYEPLAKMNQSGTAFPIYVGKADAKGKRKGGFLEDSASGVTLWKRLNDYATSISAAANLDLDDFSCRFLVIDDLWISLGESLLISNYAPVWNALVDGFGNHNPGKGRSGGMRSRWDTLHPGRVWAESLQANRMTADQISSEVFQYLVERCPCVRRGEENVVEFGVVGIEQSGVA